jgi:hypothetical protein
MHRDISPRLRFAIFVIGLVSGGHNVLVCIKTCFSGMMRSELIGHAFSAISLVEVS